MAEDEVIGAIVDEASEFQNISNLTASDQSVQLAFTILIIGLVGLAIVYRFFSNWVSTQKFYYVRPHLARLIKVGVLPFLAIILVTSMNVYIQSFDVFDEIKTPDPESTVVIDATGDKVEIEEKEPTLITCRDFCKNSEHYQYSSNWVLSCSSNSYYYW